MIERVVACNQDALKRKKIDSDAFKKDIDLEEDFLKVQHDLNTCLTMAEIEKQIIELGNCLFFTQQ
jgi:hypothetical protein